MAYLTVQLDDVNYQKLRELSQSVQASLQAYATEMVALTLSDHALLSKVEQSLSENRQTRFLDLQISELALIGQVQELVCDVAPTDFNATSWTIHWLKRPLPALGGRLPREYLSTDEGRLLLSILISTMNPAAFWCDTSTEV